MSESETSDGRMFAWNHDRFDGCKCPAVEAGYSPATIDESTDVAETFDRMVRQSDYYSAGLVPEDVAEECWEQAVHYLEEQNNYGGAAVGRMIADELGWEVSDE